MQFIKKERPNLMITDTVIRYFNHTKKGPDYGKIELEPGIVDDGKIIDQTKLFHHLKTLVKNKKWSRKEIAICVPDAFVTLREETVPIQLNQDEVKKYIAFELDDSIRLPFKKPVIDFATIEETEQDRRILLVAYPKERLQSYIELFEQLHCKLTIADLSFLASYRVFQQFDRIHKNAHVLLIQWRRTDLVLTVFDQERPIFNRHLHLPRLDTNLSDSDEPLDEAKIADPDLQDMIEDQFVTIERFMDFYQYSIMNNEAQINCVLLSGDLSYLSTIKQALNERFSLPIQTVDDAQEFPKAYTELYGLSLRK